MRLRRSIIWTHGNNIEDVKLKISKGVADAICIDLEDGVPFACKAEARIMTVEILRNIDFRGRERIVRVNSFGTDEYKLDMNQVIAIIPPDSIRLPKCERIEDILECDRQLAEIEKAHGLRRDTIEIIAMIESPLGIRNGYDIAVCCKRVTALSLGMEDLTREMGVKRRYINNELDLIYARQKMVLDAKAAGVAAIDSVLLLTADNAASEKQSMDSKQAGFDGRSCANNEQATYANKVFSPDPKEVEWSKGAISVYDEQALVSKEEPVFRGQKICFAAYEKAKALVALDARIKELEARIK